MGVTNNGTRGSQFHILKSQFAFKYISTLYIHNYENQINMETVYKLITQYIFSIFLLSHVRNRLLSPSFLYLKISGRIFIKNNIIEFIIKPLLCHLRDTYISKREFLK